MWLYSAKFKLFLLGAWVLCLGKTFAQQDPMYSQYQVNMLAVNPAYAGSKEGVAGLLMFRRQWTQIEGTPNTEAFAIHAPIANDQFGIGLNLVNDNIGVSRRTNIFGSLAYNLDFGAHQLKAGLQIGATNFSNDWQSISTITSGDPVFMENESFTHPNVGFGLWYYNQSNWFGGFSIPYLIEHQFNAVNEEVDAEQRRHYFFTVGKQMELSRDIKLKPWIMLKKVQYVPLQVDVNVSAIFYDRFLLGASLRTGDGMAAMAQVKLTRFFWLGYAYDYPFTALNQFTPGSHEFFISFKGNIKQQKVMSPRYF